MSDTSPLFRFIQVELPWQLGPPDGRYLLRADLDPEGDPTHVIVFATLGAPERRRLVSGRRRPRDAQPLPEPTPVPTGRATVIDVAEPLDGLEEARRWLAGAGEPELTSGLAVLNRALQAFRLATADPYQHTIGRRQAIVARVGFGAGEQVADGLWKAARELPLPGGRQRRSQVLGAQSHLAAVLGSREPSLACAELTLRARSDIDHGREREAALQLVVALDAALAELAVDATASELAPRLDELRAQRDAVAGAAQAALGGALDDAQRETVTFTLGRIEAALRARAAASA